MSLVFLDTVGLLAVWDEDDQWHPAAAAAFRRAISERAVFVTTSYVIAECGNAASRRPYRESVVQLRQALEGRNQILFPTFEDWNQAWVRYAQEGQNRAGIVDQLSFAVMKRLGVSRVFTNDRHFREEGFEVLF